MQREELHLAFVGKGSQFYPTSRHPNTLDCRASLVQPHRGKRRIASRCETGDEYTDRENPPRTNGQSLSRPKSLQEMMPVG